MDEIQSNVQLETLEEESDKGLDAAVAGGTLPDQADASVMGGLPVADWDYQQPKRGEIRTGVILSITDQEIIVDIGAKRDGIVPANDIQRMDPEVLSQLQAGDEVDVCVLRPEDMDGNLLVSLYQARQEGDWKLAKELADSGEAWEGQVIGYNKGGLVVPLGGIRGFLPASQLAEFRPNMTQEERLTRLSEMVGTTLLVKVIEFNRRKHRLILSATVAQREWRQRQRERLLDELREGMTKSGVVSSLCPFGAFVDLGGADGLIHLSELSWRRVRHPKEVLHVGDEVEVLVLKLDRENNRIGLSLKRLQPEPWAVIEDNYELGQLVEGTVTNVVDFGAFAEIESGVEGLVHISELTDKTVTHPREVVRKGDRMLLRIIRIDARRKRLGLSLKRVLDTERSEWEARTGYVRREPPRPRPPRPVKEAGAEPISAEEIAKVDIVAEPGYDLEMEIGQELLEPQAEEIVSEALPVEEVAEEPATDEPVAEEPAADEPVAEEPVTDEPVAEEPATGTDSDEGPLPDEEAGLSAA